MRTNTSQVDDEEFVVEESYVHMNFDNDILSMYVSVDNEDYTVPIKHLQRMVEQADTRSMELRLKFSLSKDLVKNAIYNWMLGRTDTFLEEDKPMFDALRAELNECIAMLDEMVFVPEMDVRLNGLRGSIAEAKDLIGEDAVKAIMTIIDTRKQGGRND